MTATYISGARITATSTNPVNMTIQPESWMKTAKCREVDGDLFFPQDKARVSAQVRSLCETCPVRGACVEFAVRTNQRDGVWGGLSQLEIRKLMREKKKREAAA